MRASSTSLALVAALGLAGPLPAANLGIDPILLELSAASPTAVLALRNDGSDPIRIQLSSFSWMQNAKGEMQLTATTELVLFPPLLEIAPGQRRNVRVGTTADFGQAEKSFRVVLDELPALRKPGAGVQTLSQISLPVFLAAAKPVESLRIDGLQIAGGRLRFRLRNEGTVHARPRTVSVEAVARGGEKVFAHDWAGWYVLAGGEREYEVELPRDACARARSFSVLAAVDPADVRASLESASAGCGR